MIPFQSKQTRNIIFTCFFLVSVFLLNSCSNSDSSTSPTSNDYASSISGNYKITAAYTEANGWVTPPEGVKAIITAVRTGTNMLTLTIQTSAGDAPLPGVAVAFVSDKYVLSSIYSDGSLYGVVAKNQMDILLTLDNGSKTEFKAIKI